MPWRALFCSRPDVATDQPASWKIRALDLVAVRPEWRAVPVPGRAEIEAADVLVVVKSTPRDVIETARALGKPVLWDFADVHGQVSDPPEFARFVEERRLGTIVALLLRSMPADAVLVGNRTMARDFEAVGGRAFVMHFHFWPGQDMRTEVADRMTEAVYDGDPAYLSEDFLGMFRSAAARVGIKRLNHCYNTPMAERGDVALSDRPASPMRWLHLRWKPPTKPCNALAAGLPIVTAPEAGALELMELGYPGILPFADEDSLFDALVTAGYPSFRREVMEAAPRFRERFSVEAVCRRYDEVFATLIRG